MRKLLGVATIAALALGASVAMADEVTGKVENIDLTTNMLTVGGKTLQWSAENSTGVKLKDLKEGDSVKVMFEPNEQKPGDVMSISKEK
jgi:Cu/Ag efflux protein CusF